MMNCRSPGRAITITLTLCVLSSFAAYALWRHNPDVVLENHIIEWTQAALLMLACLIHLGCGRAGSEEPARQVRYGLSLFCLSLFMREVDIHTLLANEAVMHPVEDVLRGLLVVIWILFAFRLRRHIDGLLANRWRIAFSLGVIFSLAGCVAYATSWLFDKRVVPIEAGPSMFIEETVQLNATILIAAGALVPVMRAKDAGDGRVLAASGEVESGDRIGGRDQGASGRPG